MPTTFLEDFEYDTYSNPTSDGKLIYDNANHWYLLNPDYVMNTFGEYPINDEVAWKQLQYNLTNNLYRYIYKFKSGREDHDHIEYELACNQRFREVLCYCLLEQYQYATSSSGDILHYNHGVDISNEKLIEKDALRNDLIIADFVEDALLQAGILENGFKVALDNNFYQNIYRKGY